MFKSNVVRMGLCLSLVCSVGLVSVSANAGLLEALGIKKKAAPSVPPASPTASQEMKTCLNQFNALKASWNSCMSNSSDKSGPLGKFDSLPSSKLNQYCKVNYKTASHDDICDNKVADAQDVYCSEKFKISEKAGACLALGFKNAGNCKQYKDTKAQYEAELADGVNYIANFDKKLAELKAEVKKMEAEKPSHSATQANRKKNLDAAVKGLKDTGCK